MNKQLLDEYGTQIANSLIEDDYRRRLSRFLDKHEELTPKVRARMIDWFVEIVCNFKCHPNTFYLAIKIMDTYFERSKECQTLRELHLIGVTSVFLASKIEDLIPFNLKVVYTKIGHQSLPKRAILMKEKQMLETLNFNLKIPTANNYTGMFLVKMFNGTKSEHFKLATQLADYFSKVALHDYGFSIMTQNVLSSAVIYLTFVVLEKILAKQTLTQEFMRQLTDFAKVKESQVLSNAKDLLILVQNFDTKHQGLKNMKDVQFKLLSKYL